MTEPAAARAMPAAPAARRPEDDCVHCGFCLPHCPTYRSWGEEMDSPRGRIDLYRALGDGRVRLDDAVAEHFDRCLGCLACVTACPSGVRYGEILESARARVERERRRPLVERLHRGLLFALFPYPLRLRVAALLIFLFRVTGLQWLVRRSGLLRRLSPRLAALEALAPPLGPAGLAARLAERTGPAGARRLRVGLVAGCVQRVFFPGVNAATVRVLAAEGCEVIVPSGQGCCGALSLHAGRDEEARRMARELIARFEPYALDAVVVNAAGCGSSLKEYGRLLAGDPAWAARAAAFAARVKDVSELLASLAPRAPRHPFPVRVAYHSSCHLGHAQRLQEPPRAMLRSIPGLELVEVPEPDQCCGSAGVYNLLQPASAAEIGARKAEHVLTTGAALLASANPGCTLHIQRMLRERGTELPAAHPIEILDWSLRGVPPP
ncbi:(Fe-S)-binding protein [Anaeromyxobacter diazotrophicus]|uniref:Glycolate oxidase iron-sulfur subunit n=1 Tax=Anaeromyxobacter diazotrophicus TaxID=2590199 RepID=A0A7I9VJD2_9BACT|nr:(Fe-S)-binding protein [Anaeromyxobacter diazotrophicus]GEJ56137.1 glycolate oxidase iron-sulfur subunit [Anaeromyxobacter diazotrophicus]